MWDCIQAFRIILRIPIHGPLSSDTGNECLCFLYRGMVDESGDQFVAYFLPTEGTVQKRKRDAEDDVDYVPDEE